MMAACFRHAAVFTALATFCLTTQCGYESGSRKDGGGTYRTVDFHLTNETQGPRYITWFAGRPLDLELLHWESGEWSPVTYWMFCTSECGRACPCVACDAPPSGVKEIAPNSEIVVHWDGHYLVRGEQNCGGWICDCSQTYDAEDGRYRIAVCSSDAYIGGWPADHDPTIIYDASLGGNVSCGQLDFDFPHPTGTVYLSLG